MRTGNDAIRIRIRILAIPVVLLFCYVVGRLYYVQIVRHEHYYEKARGKYVTSQTTRGARGEIFDADGNLLVGNMPCQDVTITPCNIKKEFDRELTAILCHCLELDFQPVYAKVSRKSRSVTDASGKQCEKPVQYAMIAREVPLEKARELKNILMERNLSGGVHFHNTTMRYYPKGKLLSNVLGFTSMDQDQVKPVIGVEKFFNKEISAASGKRVYERTRDGRPLGETPLKEIKSRDGLNLYLTIREPIQAILEEELDRVVEKWRPKAAYAVMADPRGNILAMAQRPSFDPNDRKNIDPASWRIRIIEDVFEPGSIMKAVTVAGALDYGAVTPQTMIDCGQGHWTYLGRPLTDTHGYGMQNVTGVIRKSSNIGTAKIALLMGKERLNRTLRKFGFGSRTGLPLKPETRGIFPSVDRWDGLSITRFGMGYGIAVSPVQMLRAYCALAGRGKLPPTLRLVDRVEDPATGEVVKNPEMEPVNLFQRKETGEEIVNMMITVTEPGGTATQAAIPGYHVAGKTGTARKIEHGHYVSKYYGSFVGFVPAENPAFVLLVTLDEPKGHYYGGLVAGPAWKAIAERTLKYLDIKPNVPLPEKKRAH